MKKILITGGAGFIGSHLVDSLVKKKYKIIVIDNLISGRKSNLNNSIHRIKFIKADISILNKIESYFKKVDAVIHLAALADIVPSIHDPNSYYETNVTGTFNVLSACKKHNIKKIIYAASASCYGISKELPTSEQAEILPKYPYALTKRLGEELIVHWGEVYDINYTSLRFFNVYGPRSRTSGAYGAMFGVFFAQKLANKPYTIVGSGNQKRDFTYVSDAVRAIILSLSSKKSKNQIFNVGTGKCISINQIIDILKGDKIYIPKRPGEPDITFAKINKIKKFLNWRAKISIRKGIAIMLGNIDYWKKAPVWTAKKIKIATKDWFKYLK